jgi:Trk-type K+ transport system membrane component
MIEAAILFIKEQVAALVAAYQVLKRTATSSASSSTTTTTTRLSRAWNAAFKKQNRSVRSAYIQFVALFCLIPSFILGGVMYAIEDREGTPRSFVDCLFTMASAASSTGLLVLDTSILQVGSKALIGVVMFGWSNTLLIAAAPMLFRICRLRAARKRCNLVGEKLKRRREAFNHLYEAKEKQEQLHNKQSLYIVDEKVKSVASTSIATTIDVSVEMTTSEGTSIFVDKKEEGESKSDKLPTSSSSSSSSSTSSLTEGSSTSIDSLSLSSSSSSSSSSLPNSKKPTSRRNSRRNGTLSASPNMETATTIASAADSVFNSSSIENQPVTSSSSSLTPPSSPSDSVKPVELSFSSNSTKPIDGHLDSYSIEKKTLQSAVNTHAEHDALLTSLENGPYLLGHYLLFSLIVAYYFFILIVGFIAYVWHFSVDPKAMAVIEKNPSIVSVSFFSAFFSVATVTNGGFYLFPDGLIQLGSDQFTITITAILATLGFCLHPLGLRIFIIMVHAGSNGRYKAALRDILDNPRRYYTHLFSEKGTWAATLLSLAMTGLLFAFYLVFNYPDNYFRTMFPQNDIRAMNGWFEAIMVYNAWFNTYDLSMMDVGSQVFMMLCMWATGRPFTLGILVTASESSISADDADDSDGVDEISSSSGSVWTVFRELLMLLRSDLIILVICTLMICMYDNAFLTSGVFTGPNLSIGTGSYIGVFPIAFDLSSAYGNVGLSLGFPNTVTSTCAVLSPFGKLIVIFMW